MAYDDLAMKPARVVLLNYDLTPNVVTYLRFLILGRVWLVSPPGLARRAKTSQAEQGLGKEKLGQKRR